MSVVIERAAALTTVQDLGRQGLRHLGVARAGAWDAFALRRANALLGNAPGAAGIELVAAPLHLRFEVDTWFALCGAAFELHLDDRPLRTEWRWPARAGQVLRVQGPGAYQGRCGLLAMAGGVDLPAQLGAVATDLRAGLGGLEGRALRAGDRLPLGAARALQGVRGLSPAAWTPELRVLPGLEFEQLCEPQALLAQEWTLNPQSDRMGARLMGETLALRQPLEMDSHAVWPGLIQLPPGGQPIVLQADAQTTGGYPRLGMVIAADQWKLAQARPGQGLRLRAVTGEQAVQALAERERELEQWQWRCRLS
ncbi:biotin-dependent carboxylase-like uncharacterized protein [Inhella inkyongensis]|uniref:Biotin-dependent carboxylase-like uncharacterized protein n=1 Tax=Inhella inkyongensis TaxID=392593 RepID=A0A840S827_9BURK|nr:biotin-dependent carboxyltransferase family protein [Inhella inkyongensis]MBB5204589.1 biotin-dependent carboxylase-like uncharacterized protein [Inhella inkyongensis]